MLTIAGENIFMQHGEVHVVNDVSMSVCEGEQVALIGHTGCGKTTLALILAGLIGPSAGQVSFAVDEKPVTRRKDRRRLLRLQFQDPESVFNPGLKIKTTFYDALKATRGWSRAQTRFTCLEYLELLDLPERAWNSYPTLLSYGQKARLNVLRSVLTKPRILIADEPFVGIDVPTKLKVAELMRREVTQAGIGLILITHDYSVLEGIVNNVYVMAEGRMVERAALTDLFDHNGITDYTKRLLASQSAIASHEEDETIG